MKIAVAAQNADFGAKIPALFSESEWVLIIDTDKMQIISAINDTSKNRAEFFAKQIVLWDCELIICGGIEAEPFRILADDHQVTRYDGAGLEVEDAVIKMLNYSLPYIKAPIGGDECDGEELYKRLQAGEIEDADSCPHSEADDASDEVS